MFKMTKPKKERKKGFLIFLKRIPWRFLLHMIIPSKEHLKQTF